MDTLKDMVAGWVAGAASIVVSQPLDTALTRLQNSPASVKPVDVLKARSGLMKGWLPMASVVPLQNALLFAGYGAGERFAKAVDQDATLSIFLGGCLAGLAQCTVAGPAELLKVRLQLSPHGAVTCASHIYATWGVAGLWRGMGMTIIRDAIPHGVWFVAYQRAMDHSEHLALPCRDILRPLGSGALAATVAWTVSYPADPIKTRIQASREPLTITACARQLLAEHNGSVLSAFYRGFPLKLARAIPSNAVAFLSYEWIKNKLL